MHQSWQGPGDHSTYKRKIHSNPSGVQAEFWTGYVNPTGQLTKLKK